MPRVYVIDCFLSTPLTVTISIPSYKYKDLHSRLSCGHIKLSTNNNWFQFKLFNLSYIINRETY